MTPENNMDCQERKSVDHQTNPPRVLTRETTDQAQIILFWIYVKIEVSGKDSNAGKVEGKKKKRRGEGR